MTIQDLYTIFKKCGKVSTDSRKISGGELFFALKGENFDGNAYASKALEDGAAYVVVSDASVADMINSDLMNSSSDNEPNEGKGQKADNEPMPAKVQKTANESRAILVEDTLKTLQDLARWHRAMSFVSGSLKTVLGLTGTNGKTTTKELLRAVLSTKYKVKATEGNLNNSIGVPLTLLEIDDSTEIAIVEMGASHPGDINELVSVALPNYGLITNVGRAHLAGFGSFEGVMKAKGELYDYIQRTADKAFVNVDNEYLRKMASQRPDLITIPYGLEYEQAKVLDVTEEFPYLRLQLASGLQVSTSLVGSYNSANVMAAIAVGREFGVSEADAVEAISAYKPSNNRSQLVSTGRNTVIVDAYNANPTSVEAALLSFASLAAEKKMVLLGNMLELGDDSASEHARIVSLVGQTGVESWFVGPEFRQAALSAGANWVETSSGLATLLKELRPQGYTILLKGSRGTRMETVLESL